MTFCGMNTADREKRKKDLLILIGQNIRRIRKEKGWSQERLAHESDVDRTYLGYVENGKHNVSIFLLFDLAEALDVEIHQLIHILDSD